jgi:hypothetical protein
MAAGQDQMIPPSAVKTVPSAATSPSGGRLSAWRREAAGRAADRAAVPAVADTSRESGRPCERATRRRDPGDQDHHRGSESGPSTGCDGCRPRRQAAVDHRPLALLKQMIRTIFVADRSYFRPPETGNA